MRIAYLILAHDQPAHLLRQIRALNADFATFFVHIDAKVDIEAFRTVEAIPNATLIPNRVEVNWGGYSMVEAELALLSTAVPHAFDYYVLLSGRDYPIKPNWAIHQFLEKQRDTSFLTFYPVTPDDKKWRNYTRYHLADIVTSRTRHGRLSVRLLLKMLGAINVAASPRELPFGYRPYAGSQWWMLTHDLAEYALTFATSLEAAPLVNFFKLTMCPDEGFFQTIIVNAPFVKQETCVRRCDPNPAQIKQSLHYIDFSPWRENPAILDHRDYGILRHTEALFARKFDTLRSAAVLDRIDAELLTRKPTFFSGMASRSGLAPTQSTKDDRR